MGRRAAVEGLLESRELWGSLVIGAGVAIAAATDPVRSALPSRLSVAGLSVAAGVSGGLLVAGRPALGLTVALAIVLVWRSPSLPALPTGWALASVGAAGAIYACVPDTERALAVAGACVGAGAITELQRRPWTMGAVVATIPMAWVALVDGPERASAFVGASAVVLVHVLAIVAGLRRAPFAAVVAYVLLAAWCGRVAGLADSGALAVALAAPALLAAAALTRLRWPGRR